MTLKNQTHLLNALQIRLVEHLYHINKDDDDFNDSMIDFMNFHHKTFMLIVNSRDEYLYKKALAISEIDDIILDTILKDLKFL